MDAAGGRDAGVSGGAEVVRDAGAPGSRVAGGAHGAGGAGDAEGADVRASDGQGLKSTMSSRWMTSRSYSWPRSRASQRVERPIRAGISVESKLTRPRATTAPSGAQRSTGSPGS